MIRSHGAALVKVGYSVIPVTPHSKIPSISSWQKHPLSSVNECLERPEDEGVGILCGFGDNPVVGLDCDIDGDAELSALVRSRFNEILGFEDVNPIRHGKRPKFLILGRIEPEERFSKFSSVKFSRDDGKTAAQIEVLGAGHFFVAYGIHPDTGKPYEWEDNLLGEFPEDIPIAELPIFSVAKLRECLKAFEEEVAKRGGYSPLGSATQSAETSDWTAAEPQKQPLELETKFVETILKDLTEAKKINVDDYESWLQVGMALHHQFGGNEEGKALWNEWSAASSKYDPNAIEAKWATFGNYPAKMRTMRSLVHLWYALDINDKYALCEAGLMHRVIRESGNRIRYVADLGKFRVCNAETGRWVEVSETEITSRAFNVIENSLVNESEDVKEQGFAERSEAILKFRARSRASMSRVCAYVAKDLKATTCAKFTDFDNNPMVFGVGNGAVDLQKGKFVEPRPDLMLSKGSYVDYVEGARNERWEQFIDEITAGDKDTADYLQRIVGYAMSGVPNQHLMFFLIGRGCNGKSVFLNTLAKVFGSYHRAVPADYFTQTERQVSGSGRGPDSVLVSMAGSRLCVSSETALGASMQEAVIKRLVSRDALTARPLYSGTMMEIVPSWVLFVATNHFPDVRTHDKGTWRRIRAIEFGVDFDDGNHEMDPWLEDKLAKNLPGILNWCLEGYRKYRKFGVGESKKAASFTEDLREQADVISRWMSECCVQDPGESAFLKEAYASWSAWARKDGSISQYPNDKIFGQVLSEYGFVKRRMNNGYAFYGFRMLTEEELTQAKNEETLLGDFA